MSALKYGVVLPYGDPRATAEQARMAEAGGWDGVFVGDAIWCLDPLIQLTAAAMTTTTIRLGTQVLAAPLRVPWTLASQTTALDILSGGRLTLGLGMGAVWMGWQGFPDVVTDTRGRAELLDETIDILTQMARRQPFDYDGKHYHIKLTRVDAMHYPPAPVQQPRVPIWVPGVWPRMKSMRRVLKCDGLFPVKMDAEGKFVDVTPADVRAMKEYVAAHRTLDTPFDIAVDGRAAGLGPREAQDKILPWVEAGATWWIEAIWGVEGEELEKILKDGPPGV